MGLFSSRSSSKTTKTTNYNDNSVDTTSAATLGALASDNLVMGSNSSYQYVEGGLTGDNLTNLLDTVSVLSEQNQNTLSGVFNNMVGSVQKSAETAINTTAQAYAESDDELRRAIDGLRPIALYAAIAFSLYFIFKGSR